MKSMCNGWNFCSAALWIGTRYDGRNFPFRILYWDIGLIKKENKIIEAENKELKVETYWHAVILGTNQMELRYSIWIEEILLYLFRFSLTCVWKL